MTSSRNVNEEFNEQVQNQHGFLLYEVFWSPGLPEDVLIGDQNGCWRGLPFDVAFQLSDAIRHAAMRAAHAMTKEE